MPEPVRMSRYPENRLVSGGALVFCSAVVVQLLHVSQLSTALWVALGAAAVAIPSLAALLLVDTTHETLEASHDSPYAKFLVALGLLPTLVCATAVLWHFSGLVGAGFLAMVLIASALAALDTSYHPRIHSPTPDNTALSVEPANHREGK